MDTDFLRFLEQAAVMPVVSLPDDRLAVPLVDALAAGGLTAVEITFRTDAAERAIERIASERPEIAVGAGTVLTAETVRRASNAIVGSSSSSPPRA
jgi:2-dehydro-3-deoxyphosphogluconate aldolase/(4S)-4-hydroxy-2-oxoglutarate aldolase